MILTDLKESFEREFNEPEEEEFSEEEEEEEGKYLKNSIIVEKI